MSARYNNQEPKCYGREIGLDIKVYQLDVGYDVVVPSDCVMKIDCDHTVVVIGPPRHEVDFTKPRWPYTVFIDFKSAITHYGYKELKEGNRTTHHFPLLSLSREEYESYFPENEEDEEEEDELSIWE